MNAPINKNIPLKNNKTFRKTATLVGINEFSGIMALTVVPLITIQIYGSYKFSALAVFVYSFTSIVAQFFSGPTVDKIGSATILKFASGAQATFWIILGTMAVTDTLDEIKFLTLTGLLGFFTSFDYPSEQQIIKHSLSENSISKAATIIQVRESLASSVAPAFGGWAITIFGSLTIFIQGILNFISFLISLTLVNITYETRTSSESFINNLKTGYKLVLGDKPLTQFALTAGIANATVAGIPLTLIYNFNNLGKSALEISFINAFFGVSVIIGGIVIPIMLKKFKIGFLGIFSLGMISLGNTFLIFFNSNYILTVIIIAVSLLPLPSFNAALMIYTNISSPSETVGSVVSAMGVPGMILMPVGALSSGFLYSTFGASTTLAIFTALSYLAFLILAQSKSIKNIGYAPKE